MYFDRRNVLSYNASLNFIVLKRGYGKSWTFKEKAIKDFSEKGLETVWLRRYKPEIVTTTSKYFDDIRDKFPNLKLEVKGKTGYCNGKPFIHFIPLSVAQNYKSVPFSKVGTLVFDEFLIEGGSLHYLPSELDTFCAFLSSVFRDRKMQVYCLGNKTKYVTPYNIYFNVCDFSMNKYYADRSLLVYAQDGDGRIEDNYAKSDLEKVLRGTKYYEYNFLNNALNSDSAFIEPRPKGLTNNYLVRINGIDVGMFIDKTAGRIYLDLKCDNTIKHKFTYNSIDLRESYFLLYKSNPFMKLLRDSIADGRVYFNDIRTKEIALPLIEYLM